MLGKISWHNCFIGIQKINNNKCILMSKMILSIPMKSLLLILYGAMFFSFTTFAADNLEHFLYGPDKLKKVTPEAYVWIKKRFGENFILKERKK